MRNRTVNEAMWDALHILGAAHHTMTRDERMSLQLFADAAEALADSLIKAREGRALNPAEIRACERVCAAALSSRGGGGDGSGYPPGKDTPPGGTRKL